MLLAGGAASAQTIAKPDQRGGGNRRQPSRRSRKPAKPAAGVREAAPAEQGTDYWAINTDIGRYRDDQARSGADRAGTASRCKGRRGPSASRHGAVRTGQFADGRTAPGLDRYNQDPQSYAGVSLSLTNSNKSFPLPTQLLPHNQW